MAKRFVLRIIIPYKSVNPKVSGGLTNMLNYKWLDLSFTLTYSLGGYSYDKTGTYIENGTSNIYNSKYNLPVYAMAAGRSRVTRPMYRALCMGKMPDLRTLRVTFTAPIICV